MESNRQISGTYYNEPASEPSSDVPPTPLAKPNAFVVASLILGVMATLSFFTFTYFPSIIMGALSIILAFLSKGAAPKMHSMAKTGIITSVIALICNIATFALVFALVFNNFEAIYGMSYEEMMEEMENGTLDYDEIYNNIYDNLYEMLPDETSEDSPSPNIDTPKSFDELYKEIHKNH